MRKIICVILLHFVVFVVPPLTLAHELVTDGTIGAVLHIEPEDKPILNQQTRFLFEFKDRANKFDPTHCNCIFRIVQFGKEIYRQPLLQDKNSSSIWNENAFYTFTQPGNYTVEIIGKPQKNNLFQAFILSYDLQISKEGKIISQDTHSWISTHSFHLFGGILIGIFVIGAFIRETVIEYKERQQK